MKKVEAIIRPEKIEDVVSGLNKIDICGMTITEVKGFGTQKGFKEVYRGIEYEVSFLQRIKIEVVINDDRLEEVTKTLIENAKTGELGDGKIFVYDIKDVIRIRTGERGKDAI